MESAKRIFAFRLTESQLAKLHRLAKANHRRVGDMVRVLIIEAPEPKEEQ